MIQAAFGKLIAAFFAAMEALKTGESTVIENPFGRNRVAPSAQAMGGGMAGRLRQTNTIITGLVIVIVSSLAVIVVDRFDQSLGDPNSSELNQSQTDILSGFADMTSLIGPLLLVLIAVVIIGVVQRVRA